LAHFFRVEGARARFTIRLPNGADEIRRGRASRQVRSVEVWPVTRHQIDSWNRTRDWLARHL
jgi:hypothetical protein